MSRSGALDVFTAMLMKPVLVGPPAIPVSVRMSTVFVAASPLHSVTRPHVMAVHCGVR